MGHTPFERAPFPKEKNLTSGYQLVRDLDLVYIFWKFSCTVGFVCGNIPFQLCGGFVPTSLALESAFLFAKGTYQKA